MSDLLDPEQRAIADRLLARLSTFASSVGVYEGIARSIIEKSVAEMPNSGDEQILDAARMKMMFISN